MDNTLRTLGVRVNFITPNKSEINVKVNEAINITFNSELNTKSIVNNFNIFKDKYLKFNDIEDLKNQEDYEPVKGSISRVSKCI